MLLLGFSIAAAVINLENASAHGCQAQGGCCTLGGMCAEGSPIPLSMMFVAVGMFGLVLISFYGRRQTHQKICSCLNIFG
jgi:hypothetical protein